MLIILVSGKAGVGKTTFADAFCEDFKATKVSFAKKVKEIAVNSFGWNNLKDTKGRELLQKIGQVGRAYDPDIWVKHAMHYLTDPEGVYIFDDWRFLNEYTFLKENMTNCVFIKIRVEAPQLETLKGTEAGREVSENSLNPAFNSIGLRESLYDEIYFNLKTLKEFQYYAVEFGNFYNFERRQ